LNEASFDLLSIEGSVRKFVFALFFVMLAAIAVAAMALRHVPVLAHLSHKS